MRLAGRARSLRSVICKNGNLTKTIWFSPSLRNEVRGNGLLMDILRNELHLFGCKREVCGDLKDIFFWDVRYYKRNMQAK